MAKGVFPGGTDYSNQTFDDIIHDLLVEVKFINEGMVQIQSWLNTVKENGFWEREVPLTVRSNIEYSIKFLDTTCKEINEIVSEIPLQVMQHHCKRLANISTVAEKINSKIGEVWHRQWDLKDYEDPSFRMVEFTYHEIRDLAVNLIDVSNMASRLKDYIGKTKISKMEDKQDGKITNSTFGDNATIVIGNQNQVKAINVKKSSFEDLEALLSSHQVPETDIKELKTIVESEEADKENKRLGPKVNAWIAKMVNKCLDGTWAIGIGAAGKLLADGIKSYYGLFP